MTPLEDKVAELHRQVEGDREAVVALCAALVAAPSVNPPGDTRAVADVVAGALRERGLGPRLVRRADAMPSVLSEVDSGRPGPHLVLNVHLDTMPPGDEDAWSVPVWELTRRSGRLYGLGMGNMKGAVAAMVHAAGLLRERAGAWTGRVSFTAVSDEVVFGDNGAAFLLSGGQDLVGDGLICGEGPGFRRLAIAEKGVLWLRLTASAPGGHSSSVRAGTSASAQIAAAVTRVDGLTGRRSAPPDELAAVSPDPDDPGLLLTANVGTVQAGGFISQVCTQASAEVDLRLPPGTSGATAQEWVRSVLADLPEVHVEHLKGWDANWTPPQSRLVRCWDAAAEQVTGSRSDYAIRLPASDASRWRRLGVPAVCFGPQPTHSAGTDDYAEEDEVLRCASLYAATALHFLQGAPGR